METSVNGENCTTEEEYFESYADLKVHQLMLEDEERMKCYKEAIMYNKEYIKGKVIMDVGAGSGVLSIFCALADAKKVYAVEASPSAEIAKCIVKENNLEHIIEVIHSKVEDVQLPNDEKVDVIISEWMGMYLLHEGMLDSVISARDKFLKTDGHIFPESATIYMAPCRVPALYDSWKNVHGIKMETMATALRKAKSKEPEVMEIKEDDLICEETALCWIDLHECTSEDLNVFAMKQVSSVIEDGKFQGMCLWFDCVFPAIDNNPELPIMLSTAPSRPQTHWKQTVIVLPEEEIVEKGEPIAWELTLKRNENNNRRYELQLALLNPDEETHPIPCFCYMTKCLVIKEYLNKTTSDGND